MYFGGGFTYGSENSGNPIFDSESTLQYHTLMFAHSDTQEMLVPVSSKNYSTLRNHANEQRYIYGSSYNDPLTFETEIYVCDSVLTEAESRQVCRLLFNTNEYHWLKLKDNAWKGVHLNCVMKLLEKIYGGYEESDGVVGYKISILCDAPFAWEDCDLVAMYSTSPSGSNAQSGSIIMTDRLNINNVSDYEKYTYPTIYVDTQQPKLRAFLADLDYKPKQGGTIRAEDIEAVLEIGVQGSNRFNANIRNNLKISLDGVNDESFSESITVPNEPSFALYVRYYYSGQGNSGGTQRYIAAPVFSVQTEAVIQHTITYLYENYSSTQVVADGQAVSLYNESTLNIRRTGYRLKNWVASNNKSYELNRAYVINEDISLSPVWEPITYNIIVMAQNDSPNSNISASFDNPVAVKAPSKQGYTFAGWTVSGTYLDTSVAEWGASDDNLQYLTNNTICINGESGDVYFNNLTITNGATITITAGWTEIVKDKYALHYTGNNGEDVVAGLYASDENVNLSDESILGTDYTQWVFGGWTTDLDGEAVYTSVDTFRLDDHDVAIDELPLDDNLRPSVYLYANFEAKNYCIAYDTNGYPASAIKSAGKKSTWRWQDYASGDYLRNDADAVVALSGAYSDPGFGTGSYYYVSTTTEVRFGLGWSFNPDATAPGIEFLSDLTIEDVSDDILANAVLVDKESNLYEITLYMIWSANYKPLEDKVALFQHTFMTYPESGNTTLRGGVYTGANEVNVVYTNAPQSAKLPAVSNADAAYKIAGSQANEIWNNDQTATDYALYNWVAGSIGNTAGWESLPSDNTNDFTPDSLTTVNGRICDYLDMVIYDPCAQFTAGNIVSQAYETERSTLANAADTLDVAIRMYTGNKNNVANSPQSSALLDGLMLKDVNLDEVISIDNENYTFNGLISSANDIFETFGFDPTDVRDNSEDYFMYGAVMGFNLDEDGYVVNPNCQYTTESVYKLFDLIYGRPADGTYKSLATDSINLGNVALYYQVKDELGANANILLKKPSQSKIPTIVGLLVSGYNSLELDEATYSNDYSNVFSAILSAGKHDDFDTTFPSATVNENTYNSWLQWAEHYQGHISDKVDRMFILRAFGSVKGTEALDAMDGIRTDKMLRLINGKSRIEEAIGKVSMSKLSELPKNMKIHFSGNGGTPEEQDKSYRYYDLLYPFPPNPERSGYVFDGWSYKKDDGATKVTESSRLDGAFYVDGHGNPTITRFKSYLYALWIQNNS